MEVFKESMIRNVELKVAESKLMTANAELEELARLDGLTGLANRRCFDRTLEAEFVRCAREGLPISVILLDVDRFKIYNDTYGHQAGDLCLQRLSLVVRNRTRKPVHLAARYGGEELVVLLPEVDTATAAAIAERIRIAIRDLQIEHRGNDSGVVTASFGVGTAYPSTDIGSPADMVRRADRCLYAAKAQGRDRVVSQLLDAEVDVAAL
jgi:diguanylate cyclase (GGDEF)-like protein